MKYKTHTIEELENSCYPRKKTTKPKHQEYRHKRKSSPISRRNVHSDKLSRLEKLIGFR